MFARHRQKARKTLPVPASKTAQPLSRLALCIECGIAFRYRQSYEQHCKDEHDTDGSLKRFSCPDCGATFCGRQQLGEHITTHRLESLLQSLEEFERVRDVTSSSSQQVSPPAPQEQSILNASASSRKSETPKKRTTPKRDKNRDFALPKISPVQAESIGSVVSKRRRTKDIAIKTIAALGAAERGTPEPKIKTTVSRSTRSSHPIFTQPVPAVEAASVNTVPKLVIHMPRYVSTAAALDHSRSATPETLAQNRQCMVCDQSFQRAIDMIEHASKEHSALIRTVNKHSYVSDLLPLRLISSEALIRQGRCDSCDKAFPLPTKYYLHRLKDHMGELLQTPVDASLFTFEIHLIIGTNTKKPEFSLSLNRMTKAPPLTYKPYKINITMKKKPVII